MDHALKAPPKTVATRPLTAGEIRIIEEAVRATLKDPDSARFNHPFADRFSVGEHYYCGQVNARNSFGGYAGLQSFITVTDEDENGIRAALALDVSRDPGERAAKLTCRQHGYPLW